MEQPSKKLIKADAKELLKNGKSRQETYEELKEEYRYGKIVADIIKKLPSKQAKEKYGKWNIILLSLLILIALIYFIAAPSIGIILWYGLLIYAVSRMLVKYYIFITVLTALGLISFAVMFVMNPQSINWLITTLMVLLNIPILILPVWLTKRLCPSPTETKETYRNDNGEQKMRVVYEFPD